MPLIPKHARLVPTAPPFDDETRAALDILGPPIALFCAFARHPDRAHAIAGWGRYYLSPTTCSPLAVEIDLGELT